MKTSYLAQHSLQATVCNWSGMPIVVAMDFKFSANLNSALAKRHHPIFEVTLIELMKAVPATLRKGTEQEQHLLALALCHAADLWDFKGPFYAVPAKSAKLLTLVTETIQLAIHAPVMVSRARKQALYPRMSVDANTHIVQAINHLNLIKDVLSSRSAMSAEDKLDWELELEAELNKVLQAGKGYLPLYGRNAVQAMKDLFVRGQVGECDYKLVEFCVNPDGRPTIEQLKEAIELLQGYYPARDEFERAEGLKVIRHLETKIEAANLEAQDYGFVEVISVRGAGTVEGLDANYTARTEVKETKAATPLSKDIEAQVKKDWAATGRSYRTIDLLLEVKRRQRELEQTANVEGNS